MKKEKSAVHQSDPQIEEKKKKYLNLFGSRGKVREVREESPKREGGKPHG